MRPAVYISVSVSAGAEQYISPYQCRLLGGIDQQYISPYQCRLLGGDAE